MQAHVGYCWCREDRQCSFLKKKSSLMFYLENSLPGSEEKKCIYFTADAVHICFLVSKKNMNCIIVERGGGIDG